MSKIGKKKILIPNEVNVSINADIIEIKGPKGNTKINLDKKVFDIGINDKKELSIKPKNSDPEVKKFWGMNRSLINNAIIGVNKGYEKILEMTGVGYRASIKGDSLNLQLGYSHDINFKIPKEVKITVEKQTIIKINGSDKQQVGMVASQIKSLRETDPYKGCLLYTSPSPRDRG